MEENFYIEKLKKRFSKLLNKKILIYGSGKYATRLIKALSDFKLIGILDRVHYEGEIFGLPILMWDDIREDTADVIILATSKNNYKIIFDRIQYYCFALNIRIFGENGSDLNKKYDMKYMDNIQISYFKKNENELKTLIDEYDVISFDLFDTLIMRKTLEPVDIFDIVEERIKKKGIVLPNFKRKRHTAELQLYGPNINQIYENLKNITGISEKERLIIMEEEIQCEKQCLIPRKKMVEIMNYAIKKGKKVCIISDMYLPVSVVETILNDLGIIGYQKLYISCEYGKGKGNGLFQIYRQDVGEASCLHIGDNMNADVIAPREYGIDSYEIKSALELVKISSVRKLLCYSIGINNRTVLGLILTELFNDPFILYNTSGFVPIVQYNVLAKLFIAPSVLLYMQNLFQVTLKKEYDAILFSARDGYLFKKIYEMYSIEQNMTPAIYFLTSRKLGLASTIYSDEDVLELCRWFSTEEKLKMFLQDLIEDNIITRINDKNYKNMIDYLISISGNLRKVSSVMRKNYQKYTDQLHIDWNKKYLFCDLNSSGTIQNALNKIFSVDLDGFYFCKKKDFREKEIHVYSVYDEESGEDFTEVVDFLETILTSPKPSVYAMDENGMPVYTSEKREDKELKMVDQSQEAILEYIQQYVELRGMEQVIDRNLPEMILNFFDCVKYEGETELLNELKHVDDLSQSVSSVVQIEG